MLQNTHSCVTDIHFTSRPISKRKITHSLTQTRIGLVWHCCPTRQTRSGALGKYFNSAVTPCGIMRSDKSPGSCQLLHTVCPSGRTNVTWLASTWLNALATKTNFQPHSSLLKHYLSPLYRLYVQNKNYKTFINADKNIVVLGHSLYKSASPYTDNPFC